MHENVPTHSYVACIVFHELQLLSWRAPCYEPDRVYIMLKHKCGARMRATSYSLMTWRAQRSVRARICAAAAGALCLLTCPRPPWRLARVAAATSPAPWSRAVVRAAVCGRRTRHQHWHRMRWSGRDRSRGVTTGTRRRGHPRRSARGPVSRLPRITHQGGRALFRRPPWSKCSRVRVGFSGCSFGIHPKTFSYGLSHQFPKPTDAILRSVGYG